MRRLAALCVLFGAFLLIPLQDASQLHAQVKIDNGADPTNKPLDDAAWRDFPAGGVGVAPGSDLWIGVDNKHDNTKIKSVSVTVKFTGGNIGAKDAKGYIAGTPPTEVKRVGKIKKTNKAGELTFTFILNPQPDWEWLKIHNYSGVNPCNITEISTENTCYKKIGKGNNYELKDAVHKTEEEMALTALTIVPQDAALTPGVIPTFTGPVGSGNWTYEWVTTNPYTGGPLPYAGIKWTSDGAGIGPGEQHKYTLSVPLTGSNASVFRYYSYNSLTGEVHPYDLQPYPRETAIISCLSPPNGGAATIDRGFGPEPLHLWDTIRIGDIVQANSDKVEYQDFYGGVTRMGSGAVMEMREAPPEIAAMFPGLTFSPWFSTGEVLRRGGGDGKYRTTCYIGGTTANSVVFLQPGATPTEDVYYAISDPVEIWDFHLGSWTLLFSLQQGEKGILNSVDGVHQLPALIEPITAPELQYITTQFLGDVGWCAVPTLTEWGLIILFVLAVAGVIWTFTRRRRAMATA